MAFDESNGIPATMLVGPTGYSGNQGGFFGNGDLSWLILLMLCGWGGFGGFGGWGGMGGFGNMQLGYDFPWLLNGQQGINNNVSGGFRDAQLHDSITSVRDGVSNLATQLCGCCGDMQMSMANGFSGVNQNLSNGFYGVQQALCNGFAGTTAAVTGAQNAISQQLYSNELASLNRSFAEQTANTAGFTGVNAGIADLRYSAATEACATRTASAEQTRDIIDAQTRGTQAILDKLCALELDGVKGQLAAAQRENLSLQNAVNMATMQASQTAQTAQILAGQAAEIDGVYNRLKNCPVPSTPVYGNVPIFNCQGQNGCGCNGNLGFAG